MNTTNLKEQYNKYIVVIAVLLFLIGLTIVVISESRIPTMVGSALINLGITVIIADLFVSTLGSRLLKEQIMNGFRKILGIEDPENTLLSQLIHLQRPHPYQVLSMNTISKMVYNEDKKDKEYNMYVIEKTTVYIKALEDNSHYNFLRGTPNGENKDYKIEVRLDGFLLKLGRDVTYHEEDDKRVNYVINYKLKQGKKHKVEIVSIHPTCMSDLNHRTIKEDYFEHKFIELTNKYDGIFEFPFDLKTYEFTARRIDACRREKFIDIKVKNNKASISEENLYNGDHIIMDYRKKSRKLIQ